VSTSRITAALVVRGRWGRLLGYERDQVTGPWILEALARRILRRDQTRVPFPDLTLPPPPTADPHPAHRPR
jgi:hypothetical protein